MWSITAAFCKQTKHLLFLICQLLPQFCHLILVLGSSSSCKFLLVWSFLFTGSWPVNSPYKWPVTRKIFPFDDLIMYWNQQGIAAWLSKWKPSTGAAVFYKASRHLLWSLWTFYPHTRRISLTLLYHHRIEARTKISEFCRAYIHVHLSVKDFLFVIIDMYHKRHCVSNHRPLECLSKILFGLTSKERSKLRITWHCEGNPSVTDEFPSWLNAERVSTTWCHHILILFFS